MLVVVKPIPAPTVRDAWAFLAGVARLEGLQVVVRPESFLCPPGWVGILRIQETVTVSVPAGHLAEPIRLALRGLSPLETTSAERVKERIRGVSDVLGPASLFYPTANPFASSDDAEVEVADPSELEDLVRSSPAEEVGESGLAEVELPASIIRQDGLVVAACGWRLWPHGIAHLSVLTKPGHRREGLGRLVSAHAIARAVEAGLIPQWRARPLASKELARSLGLVEMGSQLSIKIGDR
jgi:GNAT superfamily N-acetyltransferase